MARQPPALREVDALRVQVVVSGSHPPKSSDRTIEIDFDGVRTQAALAQQ